VKDRNRLYWDQFKQMQSLAPPPDEQAAIVKFLDYANGKIERAIRAKRKLIGLLNEQRQAIIHRAVTRGLDPNVKLKPSGIPWLGDVPEHWEIRRLRASIIDCINGLWGSDPDGESDITCVRVADFDRENLRVTLKRKTTRAIPFSARSRRLLHRGDLLIEKSGGGDKQPVGAVVIYDHDEPAVCSNFVARMPISGDCNSGFINYLHNALYSRRINVPSIKQTTGIQNLDWKSYLSELVAFPPKLEQVAIADFLDSERERFGVAISRLDREIDLLREYRTTLTADVVTGKLDVREAAKRLPDQTDEPLPPDESLEDLVDDEITEEDEA
jgi:type I restriction enzyme S subunit